MMNKETNNPDNFNQWNDPHRSLASLVRPLRIGLSQTTEGWCVEISSLTPGDAMMALAREDLLEASTILCGAGVTEWAACVDGPIELGDADAIVEAVSGSRSPLRSDVRMQSIVTSTSGDGIRAHVRNYDDALIIASSAIAQYATDLLGKSVSNPELGLIDYLLGQTGDISIKPVETEVYSSFVDIGVSTSDSTTPANATLIYDLVSDTWHGD
jgi:hypothetical protein